MRQQKPNRSLYELHEDTANPAGREIPGRRPSLRRLVIMIVMAMGGRAVEFLLKVGLPRGHTPSIT